jgi:hypothetical protein
MATEIAQITTSTKNKKMKTKIKKAKNWMLQVSQQINMKTTSIAAATVFDKGLLKEMSLFTN